MSENIPTSRWLNVIDDARGAFQIEFFRGLAFLHLIFRKPLEGMRAARDYFPQIKAWLKRMGHEDVYVCIPEGDEKLLRFEQHFGFVEYKRINGHIIMFQRC